MEMTSTRAIPAPAAKVWTALNEHEMLKSCISGCESIEPDGENAYRIVLAAKVGPVSARFTGKIQLADIDPPRAYTIRFDGSGGSAGFVKGEARVTLTSENDGTTTLAYVAKAQVGGKLAQLGSRLIDGAAQMQAEDFFTRLVAAMTPVASVPVVKRRPINYVTIAIAVVVAGAALVYFYIHRGAQ